MLWSRLSRFVLCLCAGTLTYADDSHKDDGKMHDLVDDAKESDKGMKHAMKGAKDVSEGNVQQGFQQMHSGMQQTEDGAKDGMKTVDGQQTVSGNMNMNVARHFRRLQSAPSTTGFGRDDGAKTAVKQAIAKKAKTTADKVHTRQTEAPVSSTRRLTAGNSSGLVTVDYVVDCSNSISCLQMYTLLRAIEEKEWTADILAELNDAGASPFTVEVTRHLVDMVPCAVFGKGYNDPQANNTPNGAYMATAADCQRICQTTASCKYFTWYKDTSGCWLQGSSSDLEVASDNIIAGPSLCPVTKTREAVLQEWAMGDANIGTNLAASRYAAPTWGSLLGFIMVVSAVGMSVGFACAGRRKQTTITSACPAKREDIVAESAQEVVPLMVA